MTKKPTLLAFIGLLLSITCVAQDLFWTGKVDNFSLFNSKNWADNTGNEINIPIVSGQPINRNITIGRNASIGVTTPIKGTLNAGSGNILIQKATLYTDYISVSALSTTGTITLDSAIVMTGKITAANIVVKGNSQLHLYETEPFSPSTQINLSGENDWLFLHQLIPTEVTQKYLSQIKIDGVKATAGSNVRVTEYYGGTVLIPHKASFKACYLYSGANLTGSSQYFRIGLKTGNNICAGGTSSAASFLLKKGYMACIAEQADGSGSSKVYIAEDNDIIISNNLNGKNNTVKMIRISPWRWLTKKGVGSDHEGLFNENWYYNWGAGETSLSHPDREFSPMQWGQWITTDRTEFLKSQADVTHLLGFNEPDKEDQSDMTVAQCLAQWPKLQEIGLRLGSPSFLTAELRDEFMDSCKVRGYRVDFITLHGYGKQMGPTYIRNICKPIYEKYKIPVWVTEYSYGANWNTTDKDNAQTYFDGFKSITESMDASPIVERYALFTFREPTIPSDSLFYCFESYKKVLSRKGIYFRDFQSIPSRGNPLIYRTKIVLAKQNDTTLDAEKLGNKSFSLISRNNDGTNRRRIQISTNAQKLNTALVGGTATTASLLNERFKFVQVQDNLYQIKAGNNCMALSVRNDSVVVEEPSLSESQLWEAVTVSETAFFGLRNKATGKYLIPYGKELTVGTLLTVEEIADISLNKWAQWEFQTLDLNVCNDNLEGVFEITVSPLTGQAPHTVRLHGAKQTTQGKDAFYWWEIEANPENRISTLYDEEVTFDTPGEYRIAVKARDYLSQLIYKEYVVTVTAGGNSLQQTSTSDVKIYPNPVSDQFQLSGVDAYTDIWISDLQGKILLRKEYKGDPISASNLVPGFYLLHSTQAPPVKFIKNNQ